MTREILAKIAKAKKINLADHDSVWGTIYQGKVIVVFGTAEIINFSKRIYNEKVVKFRVSNLIKKGELEFDYTTNGWQFISDIR